MEPVINAVGNGLNWVGVEPDPLHERDFITCRGRDGFHGVLLSDALNTNQWRDGVEAVPPYKGYYIASI